MLRDGIRIRLVQAPQVTTDLEIEVRGFDVLGKSGFIGTGGCPRLLTRTAGVLTIRTGPPVTAGTTIAGLPPIAASPCGPTTGFGRPIACTRSTAGAAGPWGAAVTTFPGVAIPTTGRRARALAARGSVTTRGLAFLGAAFPGAAFVCSATVVALSTTLPVGSVVSTAGVAGPVPTAGNVTVPAAGRLICAV